MTSESVVSNLPIENPSRKSERRFAPLVTIYDEIAKDAVNKRISAPPKGGHDGLVY